MGGRRECPLRTAHGPGGVWKCGRRGSGRRAGCWRKLDLGDGIVAALSEASDAVGSGVATPRMKGKAKEKQKGKERLWSTAGRLRIGSCPFALLVARRVVARRTWPRSGLEPGRDAAERKRQTGLRVVGRGKGREYLNSPAYYKPTGPTLFG